VGDSYFADDDADQQAPLPIASVWASWLAVNALPTTHAYTNYYHGAFASRFIILPDDDFRDFALYSTEVTTRIKLNRDTKTVDGTALFIMESLPVDSLLYVPITTHKPRSSEDKFKGSSFNKDSTDKTVLQWLQNPKIYPKRIQIGGDETVGYGQVALRWGEME
jgi:CRISPR-associated protein Cmr4